MLLALPLQFFFNGHIKILSFFIYLTINLVDYDFVYWTETFINSIWFSLVHKFQKKNTFSEPFYFPWQHSYLHRFDKNFFSSYQDIIAQIDCVTKGMHWECYLRRISTSSHYCMIAHN